MVARRVYTDTAPCAPKPSPRFTVTFGQVGKGDRVSGGRGAPAKRASRNDKFFEFFLPLKEKTPREYRVSVLFKEETLWHP